MRKPKTKAPGAEAVASPAVAEAVTAPIVTETSPVSGVADPVVAEAASASPVAVPLERPLGGGSFVRDPATGQLTRVIEEPQREGEADAESGEGGEQLDAADPKTDPAGTTGDNEQEA